MRSLKKSLAFVFTFIVVLNQLFVSVSAASFDKAFFVNFILSENITRSDVLDAFIGLNNLAGDLSTQEKSVSSWEVAIENAAFELKDSLKVEIEGFVLSDFKLDKLNLYGVGVRAEGRMVDGVAHLNCHFTYNPNFRLLAVAKNNALLYKLNGDELETFERLSEIAGDISKKTVTDYEKEIAIHDYIVRNYRYDAEGFFSGNVSDESHSVVGLVKNGFGVCDSYAYTFLVLCELLGVEAYLATGIIDGYNHAWNIVRLEDGYYHVDLTGDDPYPDVSGRVRYSHFNITDAEISQTHTLDANQGIICNATKFNWFEQNGLIITSKKELEALISSSLDNNKTEVMFKTKGYHLNSSAVISRIAFSRGYTQIDLVGEFGKEGSFVVSFSRG